MKKHLLVATFFVALFPFFADDAKESTDLLKDDAELQIDLLNDGETPLPVAYKNLDIMGAEHALVETQRKHYLSEQRLSWLSSVLEEGEQLRLYVRKRLAEENMPAVLEYLPVVESAYNTRARSRSGALGLWQFMENSVKPYLVLNDFVDERLDPWKETDAALAKLKDNFTMFHDWPLALAAYNCGAGALSRVVAQNPGKDYWYLAENGLLRKQTAEYVPKLLAIADIAENSAYYRVELPDAKNEDGSPTNPRAGSFDYVETDKAISIRRLAHELKIDEATLLRLNPAFVKGITPPSGVWQVRLPEGMAASARVALASIEPYQFQTQYTAVSGDSLWSIARRFGTTVAALCEANGINENAILRIGKTLYIPTK